MIVWIDEEERTTFPSRLLLKKRGFEVLPVANATDGYQQIVRQLKNGLTLAIVDVMLLQGDDIESFSDKETNGGVLTGLVLARKLIERYPDVNWSKNLIIFSRASDPDIVTKIENFCDHQNLKYVRKNNEYRASTFLEWLDKEGLLS